MKKNLVFNATVDLSSFIESNDLRIGSELLSNNIEGFALDFRKDNENYMAVLINVESGSECVVMQSDLSGKSYEFMFIDYLDELNDGKGMTFEKIIQATAKFLEEEADVVDTLLAGSMASSDFDEIDGDFDEIDGDFDEIDGDFIGDDDFGGFDGDEIFDEFNDLDLNGVDFDGLDFDEIE